jgi:hypothetical protein
MDRSRQYGTRNVEMYDHIVETNFFPGFTKQTKKGVGVPTEYLQKLNILILILREKIARIIVLNTDTNH